MRKHTTMGGMLAGLVAGLATGGCMVPQAELVQVHCEPIREAGQLRAMAFVAAIEAYGLENQQVLYQVELADGRLRPIESRNGRFENRQGQVAASKTLFVPRSPSLIRAARVVIPAAELEVRPEDLPVWARFAVYLADGTALSTALARVPLAGATANDRVDGAAGAENETPNAAASGVGSEPREAAPADSGMGDASPLPPPEEPNPPPGEPRDDASGGSGTLEVAIEDGPGGETTGSGVPAVSAHTGQEAASPKQAPLPVDEPTEETPRPAATQPAPRPAPQPRQTPVTAPPAPEETKPPVTAALEEEVDARKAESETAKVYRVRAGDTLSSIALRHYGDPNEWEVILQANPGVEPRRLQVGQILILPPLEGKGRHDPERSKP